MYLKKNLSIYLFTLLIALIMFQPSSIKAVEFLSLDHIAISTGGAGVASSSSSFGSYYNPALLSRHQTGFEWVTSVGFGIREINLADHIDKLSDIGLDETIDNIEDKVNNIITIPGNFTIPNFLSPSEQKDIKIIKDELRSIAKENGLQIMPNVSVGFQIGNFGIGLFSISELTAMAVIDDEKLGIIVKKTKEQGVDLPSPVYVEYSEIDNTLRLSDYNQYLNSSLEYALDNEETYIQLKGISYYEIPIAYSRTFRTPVGDLSLGGSFKFMPGYTYEKIVKVDTESGEISDEFDDGSEHQDATFGIDLGFLFSPKAFNDRLTAGLVVKNMNSPKFETKTGAEYTLDPHIRAGMSYHIWKDTLMLALDYDISENETFLKHYSSQNMGGGLYFKPSNWMSLRCGIQQNIKESDAGTLLTAGIGFGLKWFKIDLAAQYSTETTEYDGNEIPSSGRVQLSLVSNLFYGKRTQGESQYQDIDQRDIAKESVDMDDTDDKEVSEEISDSEEPVNMEEVKDESESEETTEQSEISEDAELNEAGESPKDSDQDKDSDQVKDSDQEIETKVQLAASDVIATTPAIEPSKETVETESKEESEPSPITETKPKKEVPKIEEKSEACPTNDAAAKMRETININTALKKWAKSWSSMNVDAYLSMYGPGFTPAKGLSRSKWEQKRRKRLKKAFIKVDISRLSIAFTDCTKAEANFVQSYASPKYKDKTRKTIVFEKVNAKWLIVKEQSLK
ncbi:conserved hypothetical protein, secreted [Candidatus Magnetomorum sp. HK-1]|nr:conserved hypothetical protein, secreted [Candidatus Magnetomorum sp. HK-1]